MAVLLGIDPGASGGIAAWYGPTGDIEPMPQTEGDILNLLLAHSALGDGNGFPKVAYIESLVKHMGAGIPASTMAVYASNHGFLVGALMALGWRVEIVTPQVWQKALGCGTTGRQRAPKGATADQRKAVQRANAEAKREWKNKLKAMAQRLYPGIDVTLKTCDALLILEFARRQQNGGKA